MNKYKAMWWRLAGTAAAQAPGLSFDVSFGPTITLERLDVESAFRWNGVATRFIMELLKLADEYCLPIELEVGNGTDETDIVEDLPLFYSRFGFYWMDGYMQRNPETAPPNGERG